MTAYHALALPLSQRSEIFKEAGAIRSAIDGAWNATRDNVVNPLWNAGAATVSQAGTTATALPRAAAGLVSGAVSGAKQGLGGFAQGAVDGAYNSGAATIASTKANWQRATGGAPAPAKSMEAAVPAPAGPPVSAMNPAPAGPPVSAMNPAPAGPPVSAMNPAPAGPPSPVDRGLASVGANIAKAAPDFRTLASDQAVQARFRKAHGTAFDPNSRMDRGKLQGML